MAEKLAEAQKVESMEEPLIVFISVEGGDEDSGDVKALVASAFEEIETWLPK